MDSDDMLAGNNTLKKFMCYGAASGLLTPPLNLLDNWMPALLFYVGIYDGRAGKLASEVFGDDADNCFRNIIPTIIFATIVWMLIYMLNRLLVKSYHSCIVPMAESLVKWLKEVYRF